MFKNKISLFFLILAFVFIATGTGLADDTCVFGNTDSEAVKPNILLLMDTGAEAAEIVAPPEYEYSVDYTPDPTSLTITNFETSDDGNNVTFRITVANFDETAGTVSFDGSPVIISTNTDGTLIEFLKPISELTIGTAYQIIVANSEDESVTKNYTYTSANPLTLETFNTSDDGTNVTFNITVANFDKDNGTVTFAGIDVTDFTTNTDGTVITFTKAISGLTAGTEVPIVVANPNGENVTQSYTYSTEPAPLSITSFETSDDGTDVTFTVAVANFDTDNGTVTFDGSSVTDFSTNTDGTIITFTKAISDLTADTEVQIVVANSVDESVTQNYTYTATPTVPPSTYTLLVNVTHEQNTPQGFNTNEDVTGQTSSTVGTITAITGTRPNCTFTITYKSGSGFVDGEEIRDAQNSTATITSGAGAVFTTIGSGEGGESSNSAYIEDKEVIEIPVSSGESNKKSNYPKGVGGTACAGSFNVGANGFTSPYGYAITSANNTHNLTEVCPDLQVPATGGLANEGTDIDSAGNRPGYAKFTVNNKSLWIPIIAASKAIDGVIDGAGKFRYSANYLNWLFFSGEYDGGDNGDGKNADGSYDLPGKSRLYFMKKAIFTVVLLTGESAIYNLHITDSDSANGATQQKDFDIYADEETNTLDSQFITNINSASSVIYSPLAEMLASAGGAFKGSNKVKGQPGCADNFIILVSPGRSAHDQNMTSQAYPEDFSDADGDGKDGYAGADVKIIDWDKEGEDKEIPLLMNEYGSSYADDVSYYLYTTPFDVVTGDDGKVLYNRIISTYTVGFVEPESKKSSSLFMRQISNNGNGLKGIDNTHPKYGAYHFEAESPDALAQALWDAISAILSRANTFTAPVVPVVETTSGDSIYMAFFKPRESNFWDGNLMKYGLSSSLQYLGKDLTVAVDPDTGQFTGEPFWQIQDWSDPTKDIYMDNQYGADQSIARTIYTHKNEENVLSGFDPDNAELQSLVGTLSVGGNNYNAKQIMEYVRGADILDMDRNGNTTENRDIITGDILHSTPEVVRYADADGNIEKIRVFYATNEGLVHAVKDSPDLEYPLSKDGKEAWAFIPSDQLERLHLMLADQGHQDFIDSSPNVYISDDKRYNRYVDADLGEKAILVCGERKGGRRVFAINVTDPDVPELIWYIDEQTGFPYGEAVPEMGETWSEPSFGKIVDGNDGDKVKTVCFLGGGRDVRPDGKIDGTVEGGVLLVIDLYTGKIIRRFPATGSYPYSFPSAALPVDINGDELIDKVYIADLGGQVWRFGDVNPTDHAFPERSQKIEDWTAQVIFTAPQDNYDITYDTTSGAVDVPRQFYYPPTVTLEDGFDLVFITSGDRDDPCNDQTTEKVYCIADDHTIGETSDGYTTATLTEGDLVNVTDAANSSAVIYPDKKGWYITLDEGEKGLAQGTVFYGIYYFTTFVPFKVDPDDPNSVCNIGGTGKLWGVEYRTGGTSDKLTDTMDGDQDRSTETSTTTIPPPPVVVVPPEGPPGILVPPGPGDNPDIPPAPDLVETPVSRNYFELWWKPCEGNCN